jgi:hypothetical protein
MSPRQIEQEAIMPTLNVPPSTPVQTPSAGDLAALSSVAKTADGETSAASSEDAGCNLPAAQPGQEAPHDGDHNQGGARPAGLEYQRELGTEQDA